MLILANKSWRGFFGLKFSNFLSCLLQIFLQGSDAVMGFFSVDKDRLLTCLALDFLIAALFVAMEIHIFSKESEATSLLAWLNHSIAGFNMVESLSIAINALALLIGTLELHLHQILLHSSVHFSPLDFLVAEAFLWAAFIFFSPWSNAGSTENRLAAAALKGFLHNVCANRATEEVSSLPQGLVSFNKIGHVQFALVFMLLNIRFWNIWQPI
jgi:hypothetical protein